MLSFNATEYGNDTLTKEVVVNAIRAHYFKHKVKDEDGGKCLFVSGRPQMRSDNYSNVNGNYKGKLNGRGHSHGKSQSRLKGGSAKMYYYYNKEGYFKRECKKRIRYEREKGYTDNREATVAKGDYRNGDVLVVCSSVSERQSKVKWILDSNCTYHMCPNK